MRENIGEASTERSSGCGLLNAVFGRRTFWPRRATSTGSLSTPHATNHGGGLKSPTTPSRRQRGNSDEAAFLEFSSKGSEAPPRSARAANPYMPPNSTYNQQHQVAPKDRGGRGAASVPATRKPSPNHHQGYGNQVKTVPREAVGISGELESMIADHQKSRGSNTLVRASSSNVMLYGNLGNLRQPGQGNSNVNATSPYDYPQKSAATAVASYGNYNTNGSGIMGGDNKVKKPSNNEPQSNDASSSSSSASVPASFCRALSTRMDPETLKIMGNEDYKNGRFAEALALYEAAISIDPSKASYRSNKSAALTALGRLLEAVFECKEAIRIEPHYQRAHNRLASLYLRLGEAEKAIYHYKHAGPEADPDDIAKAKNLQVLLQRCTDARKVRDWNTLIKESSRAISSGADSAPQIFALQAEAFLKLHRHQDADETLSRGPNFDVDACTKFLGPIGNANLLVVRAQVDMAVGRFEDALEAVQRAARLDSTNREANMVMKRARAVAAARARGNDLFKASRFSEACSAYGEGLDHDPHNSVLLCNRAACRAKLGQYEKAIEDCSHALNVRPSYSKARLRRADCYAKLEKWEASLQDYDVLRNETPEDEEVVRALSQVQAQLKRHQPENGRVVSISTNDQSRQHSTSSGWD